MIIDNYIDKFVTAKLANTDDDCRQGWVVNWFGKVNGENLFIIKGQSGNLYTCQGEPVIVKNPPLKH